MMDAHPREFIKAKHISRLKDIARFGVLDQEPAVAEALNTGKEQASTPTEDGGAAPGALRPSMNGNASDMDIGDDVLLMETAATKTSLTVSTTPAAVKKEVKTSATLSGFVKKLYANKRMPQEIEVPETIPLNDYILEDFGRTFDQTQAAKAQLSDDEEEEVKGGRAGEGDGDEEEGEVQEIEDGEIESPEPKRRRTGGDANGGKLLSQDDADDDVPRREVFKSVKVFNVWFQSKEADLKYLFSRFGELDRFEMLTDRDTKRFRGIIIVAYKKPADAVAAVEKMNGQMVDGRAIRVEPLEDRRKSGVRNESRYFLLDKSLFCRRCHGVGHTDKWCDNAAKAKPCSNCASLDGHEADNCPEKLPETVGGLFCLDCGEMDHEERDCRTMLAKATNANARCLRCGSMGHTACGIDRGARGRPRHIYCFRCGGDGHTGRECPIRPLSGMPGPGVRRHSYGGTHIRFEDHVPPPPPLPSTQLPQPPVQYGTVINAAQMMLQQQSYIPQPQPPPPQQQSWPRDMPQAPSFYLNDTRGLPRGLTQQQPSPSHDDRFRGGRSQYHPDAAYHRQQQDYHRRRSAGY